MHQTTVRFGPDLWLALETECARLGVSKAQYMRESALARLAYTAGLRGEPGYEHALLGAGIALAAGPKPFEQGDERTAQQRSAEEGSANYKWHQPPSPQNKIEARRRSRHRAVKGK